MRNFDLTLAAEEDLTEIWVYTFETWGRDQAENYYDQVVSCCEAIGRGEARSRLVKGLANEVYANRCAQHCIFFLPGERPVVLAILHGRMDFVARLRGRL